jgi:hypothetical protein
MKFKFCSLVILLFVHPSLAKEKKSHGAHVHGSGNLSLAFDGAVGKVEFDGPAESILGFEHTPRSAKDKATLESAIQVFENKIGSIVQFEPSLNCVLTKEKIGLENEGSGGGHHADFSASFGVKCEKNVLGSKVNIDFSLFPRVENLSVIALVDDVTKKAKLKKQPLVLDLSK